jgi:predicted  nucleic acid-binding Zn-ribbon protein
MNAHFLETSNMNNTITVLTRLVELTQPNGHKRPAPARQAEIKRLRERLPESLLRRFDRLLEHGHRPIARLSESGACGSCHLRLPPDEVLNFRRAPDQVHACPHCGCVLFASAPLREAEATASLLNSSAHG